MKTPDTIDDAHRIAIEQERVEQAEAQRDAAREKADAIAKTLASQDDIDAANIAVEQERSEQARALRDENHDEDSVVKTNADIDDSALEQAEKDAEGDKPPAKKAAAKKAPAKKAAAKKAAAPKKGS
jgi:hypothetical protein